MFPLCLSVASGAPFRTRKGCMQLITSHDKKDYDGKTNGLTGGGSPIGCVLLEWKVPVESYFPVVPAVVGTTSSCDITGF